MTVTNSPLDIDALLVNLEGGLRILALRRLGNTDDARDAAQETLARLIERIRHGRCESRDELIRIAYGIAHHVIADALRRRGRVTDVSETLAAPESNALDRLVTAEDISRVRSGLAALSPADRELMGRCFVAGERIAAIAKATGEPPERVRKRKSRALQRLRQALGLVGEHGHESDPSAIGEK